MDHQEQIYRIGITLIPGVGDVLAKKLIAYCGSPEAVFSESKNNLIKIPDIGLKTARAITTQQVLHIAEKEVKYITQNNIKPLYFLERDYPYRLKQCEDGPVMLYSKGNISFNTAKVISVVGTRQATQYGKSICQKLVEGLKSHKLLVISGLAYGIDIQAHKTALANQVSTVGVVAHGLNMIYPSSHHNIAEKMMENGGLVTEFISGTNPEKENFPKRNRIIAGLSDAVLVIESAKKGGGLITADIANSYNREVLAVPGNAESTYSAGCNWLIKTNRAALVENTSDMEYLMGWEKEKRNAVPTHAIPYHELSEDEKTMMDLLSVGKTNIDELFLQSKLSSSQVSATLLNLEFAGFIKSLPGKVYQLN
jgi:DNA processing protein